MSLRTRLVLGTLALATLGLLVADIATYASLRSFLIDQIDSTLQSDHIAVEQSLRGQVDPDSCDRLNNLDPTVYVQLRTSSGALVCTRSSADFSQLTPPEQRRPDEHPARTPTRPAPEIDTTIPSATSGPRYFDTGSVSGSARYRVRSEYEPDLHGGPVLVVARPLHSVQDTLGRLLWIEILASLGVLAGIALLGLWTVRIELRPLEEMGKTADAIAAGDLTRRVETANDRTEVGRLGLALNAMLAEIEGSHERLRRFVADASHELRTPLAAVRAYAELFTRGADRHPDDLARAMAGIGRESRRMSLLVEDLLLLARLDEGRPFERRRVRLDEVAAEAVETARAVEPGRPIALDTHPAVVLGDHDRLRQVFDNLLSNVRAHTPPGSAASVRVGSENGNAVIEVADSGPGLGEGGGERIFERFYRADASRSRKSGGVGLGLAIVAAVAEAHEGSVSATSEPGEGTTFRIELPLDG